MVSEATRQEIIPIIRALLPKRIDPDRVTLDPDARTSLRVLLDGALVDDWCFGVCGWFHAETTASGGRDALSVSRAIRRAQAKLRAEWLPK